MDIKIDKPSPACSRCGRAFRDGEELTAALTPQDVEDAFQRHDVCNQCWPKEDVGSYRCFWSTTHSERRRSPLLDADLLWQVLHKCLPRAAQEVSAAEFAYVAALGLMRLKHLGLESTRREQSGEIMVFKTRGRAPAQATFEVRDPRLDAAGIDRVQEKLADAADAAESGTPDSQGTPARQG